MRLRMLIWAYTGRKSLEIWECSFCVPLLICLNQHFLLQVMSQSSDSGPDDGWICDICKQRPENSLQLEEQLLPGDEVFLKDSNGDIWLFCWGCRLRFHMKCVCESPKDIVGRYFCCFCEDVQ